MQQVFQKRDHGGGLDASLRRFGGARHDWLDLSTGINRRPYPVPATLSSAAWRELPDEAAMQRLLAAARRFWNVPREAEIVAVPGASLAIAQLPLLTQAASVYIPGPTYNEYRAAFEAHNRAVSATDADAALHIYVSPNNPTGEVLDAASVPKGPLCVIDESFAECEHPTLVRSNPYAKDSITIKSIGKFWGLAGLRLGFVIAPPEHLHPTGRPGLSDLLGPWAVSGPAIEIGTRLLEDHEWADAMRQQLTRDAQALDDLVLKDNATRLVGGTSLFRTYHVADSTALHTRLAQRQILTRIFPYSSHWIRFGLPGTEAEWARMRAAF